MVQRVRQSLLGGPSVHSKLRAILENAPIKLIAVERELKESAPGDGERVGWGMASVDVDVNVDVYVDVHDNDHVHDKPAEKKGPHAQRKPGVPAIIDGTEG